MVRFERGQDPKVAMDIGLAKDAIEICGIAEFIMQPNGREYVSIEDEERVIVILRSLQANKYLSDPNDIRLLKLTWVTNMWGSIKKSSEKLRMTYFEEKAVKYKGKLYIIPPWPKLESNWQDVQASIDLYKRGGYELA